MSRYILALDQGTSSSRAILYDKQAKVVGTAQQEFRQLYPKPGWVEHEPEEIWNSQYAVAQQVMSDTGISAGDIAAIGITNQRETTLIWDRKTGKPIHTAIVWQDRRTAAICDQLKKNGHEDYLRQATGLVADAYFSGTKVKWILDQVPGARARAARGELAFGTVDSWLVWKLTGGKLHITDYTNASRTLLFNIKARKWDERMLEILDVPKEMLPEVVPCSGAIGETDPQLFGGHAIPIAGIAGDQQAAMYGQGCTEVGMAKNTYGTGCFMLMNTGAQPVASAHGLLTTIAAVVDDKITYALEGSVFVAGAAIQWLRDGLKLIDESPDSEYFAMKVEHPDGVYVVPAFTGLGAPYWDMYARGAIFGITRGTTKAHLIRATLESLAYQTRDVLDAMKKDAGRPIKILRVDGGASANNLLMQFQADILGDRVERPANIETTALGAAFLAGQGVGYWSEEELSDIWRLDQAFEPVMSDSQRNQLYSGWQKAVKRSMDWEER